MKPSRRDRLLERIDRDGATVGASIPETLTVGDETVQLGAFVHDAAAGSVDPERVREVIRGLRAERNRRRSRIESGEPSRADGEQLVDSILGIDRALTMLESDGETDIEAEAEQQRRADQKRWLSFVDSVTGDTSGSTKGRNP